MRKMKRMFALTLVAAMVVSSVTSSAKTGDAKKIKAVKLVSPTKKKMTLEVGESFKIKAKVTPAKVKNKKLVFKTSKKKVATVTAKGKVKAIKVGTAKITVRAKADKKKKVVITVKVVKAEKNTEVKPSATPAASATPVASATPSTKPVASATPSASPSTSTDRAKDGSKRIHTLTLEAGETTRETVTSEETVSFTMDKKAMNAVADITDNSFVLGIGAHNKTADFKVKEVKIKTAKGTTTVALDADKVFGKGGTITTEAGSVSFKSSHKYYGMLGILCTLPVGEKASDITSIEYVAESSAGNTLCLYAGSCVNGVKELTSVGQATVIDKVQ